MKRDTTRDLRSAPHRASQRERPPKEGLGAAQGAEPERAAVHSWASQGGFTLRGFTPREPTKNRQANEQANRIGKPMKANEQ